MRWDEMNRDMWLPCMQHDLVTYPRKCMTWHDKWQAGSWVSRIPYREQVQVHASTNPSTTSSVASSGNIGRWGVVPLLTPFDSGFPTHTPIPSDPIPSHPLLVPPAGQWWRAPTLKTRGAPRALWAPHWTPSYRSWTRRWQVCSGNCKRVTWMWIDWVLLGRLCIYWGKTLGRLICRFIFSLLDSDELCKKWMFSCWWCIQHILVYNTSQYRNIMGLNQQMRMFIGLFGVVV